MKRERKLLTLMGHLAFSTLVLLAFVAMGEGAVYALRRMAGESELAKWVTDGLEGLLWICCAVWFIWDWVDLFAARWRGRNDDHED